MTGSPLAALGAAAAGFALGPWLSWAIRSLPGHEALHPVYHDCARCAGGIRRRCANAGAAQDAAVRLFSALAAAGVVLALGLSLRALLGYVFLVTCLVVAVVDIRFLIIPDTISLGGVFLGLGFWTQVNVLVAWFGMPAPDPYVRLSDCLAGVALGSGFLWLLGWLALVLLKKPGMGGGDVKLLGAFGAWLGWRAVVATVVLASFAGSLGGIAGIVWRRVRHGQKYSPFTHTIPFGPYLCLGFLFVFLFGLAPLYGLLDRYQDWLASTAQP